MQEQPDWIEQVVAARRGDPVAQAELLIRFTPLVRSTASHLIDDSHVDDVVQETFTEALRTLPALRTVEAFPSWLRLIARKQAARVRGRRPPDHLGEAEDRVDDGTPDPLAVAIDRDRADAVHGALRMVGDDDRRLLALRYLAGWTNAELAALLGISDGAVRKRLHDARRRLRPHLSHLDPRQPEALPTDHQETTMTDFRSLLGAVHGPDLRVPPASPLGSPSATPTVSGLRVIDSVAPVRRGGTIEMVGPAGTGHVVLALELLYRIGRTEEDIACVAVGAAGAAVGSQADLGHVATSPEVPGPSAAVLWESGDDARAAFDAGAALAGGLAHDGLDVVFVVDGETFGHVGIEALRDAGGLADSGAVTTVLVRPLPRNESLPAAAGCDATLVFSLEQFALGIFPAVDPVQCTSVFDPSPVGARAIARLKESADVRSWFAQPMFMAEDFTGDAGTWVEPADADADLTRLLS